MKLEISMNKNLKTVILAGGKGTRLKEETEITPKPMVKIGNQPIIEHIINNFLHYDLNNFIVCTGYKYEIINNYFSNFHSSKNFEYDSSSNKILALEKVPNFKLKTIFTGLETNTGGRLFKIKDYLNEDFILTYGDCLANIDLNELINFHSSHDKVATISVTQMESRFGMVEMNSDGEVSSFKEKPKLDSFFNIGFMIFRNEIFDYLSEDSILESEVLEALASEKQIKAYIHDGFYKPLDTYRELLEFNKLWDSGNPPWKPN